MPLEAVSAINYIDNDEDFSWWNLCTALHYLDLVLNATTSVCTRGQVDMFGTHIVVEIVMKTYGALTSNVLEQL